MSRITVASLPPDDEARLLEGVREASRFFMGEADVQKALLALARRLDDLKIPYAIAGAMAMNEFGYRRQTVDVDVLLTREGLDAFKKKWLGKGYVEKFAGSKGFRDTENNVGIDVLIAGDFPGDGKPKPVAFPDPSKIAERGAKVSVVPLRTLIELKLASGLSAPHRLKDLADVLELIRAAKLPRELGKSLDASVRAKYDELWQAAQVEERE